MQVGATVLCPHGGQATIVPSQVRAMAGTPVATLPDTTLVAGCVFTVGPKPQPCVMVRWLVPAGRVVLGGLPALVQSSTGLCFSAEQIPQGPPVIVSTQVRARGM